MRAAVSASDAGPRAWRRKGALRCTVPRVLRPCRPRRSSRTRRSRDADSPPDRLVLARHPCCAYARRLASKRSSRSMQCAGQSSEPLARARWHDARSEAGLETTAKDRAPLRLCMAVKRHPCRMKSAGQAAAAAPALQNPVAAWCRPRRADAFGCLPNARDPPDPLRRAPAHDARKARSACLRVQSALPNSGTPPSDPGPSSPTLLYTPSLARVSWMSRLRIVSCPMRSAGVNAPSTFSMLSRSGA